MVQAKTRDMNGSKKTIPLSKIRLDGDTQSRVELSEDVIHEYQSLMEAGTQLPPLLVTHDGADYWLVDGFHRRWAAVRAGIEKLACTVVQGTREDARWLSYGVNQDHGLRRTNPDKQKAVISALKHPRGTGLSDSQIAEHVGVSQPMVSKYRKELESTYKVYKSDDRTGRDGRTIDTTNIGRKPTKIATATVCPDCNQLFSGETCPECEADERELAADDDGNYIPTPEDHDEEPPSSFADEPDEVGDLFARLMVAVDEHEATVRAVEEAWGVWRSRDQ